MNCKISTILVVAMVASLAPAITHAQTPVSASVRAGASVGTRYLDLGSNTYVDQDAIDANDDSLTGADVFTRTLIASSGVAIVEPGIASAIAESEINATVGTNRIDFVKSAKYGWTILENGTGNVGSVYADATSGTSAIYSPAHEDFRYSFMLDAPTTVSVAFRIDYESNTTFYTDVEVNGNLYGLNYFHHISNQPIGTLELVVRDIVIDPDPNPREIRIHDWVGSSGYSPSGSPISLGVAYDAQAVVLFGGNVETDPILPDQIQDNALIFTDVISGLWYDPIATDGYEFEMLSDSLFTQIDALPSFLVNPVTVVAGETVLGQFNAGDSVDFSSLGGVTSFRILGISPTVDGEDPLAFPIQLSFSSGIASFSMTPIAVPEPSSMLLAGMGALLGAAALARQPSRRSKSAIRRQ